MWVVVYMFLLGGLTLPAQNAPDHLRTLIKQAQTAEQQDKLDQAVALYEQILKIRPGWASAELNLGLVHHSRADYNKAIQLLTKALQHKPSLHSALLFRGASYFHTGRYSEAVRDLKQYLRHKPEDAEALSFLANATLAMNDPAEAALAFAALARITSQPSAYFQLSECYVQLARESMTRITGTDSGAYLRLANAAVAKVIALAPESSWAALLRAQAAEKSGDIDGAEKEYERAAAGGEFESYVRYGQFEAKHGRFDRALALYEKASAIEPANARVKGLIGEAHVLADRPDKAVPFLEQALRANPRETQTRVYLAQSLIKLSRAPEAAQILEAAPEDPDGRVHYLLGRTYQQLGETEKARKAMDAFRKRRSARQPEIR